MADGDTIVIQLVISISGLGNAGDVVQLVQTPYIDNVLAQGWAVLYSGAATPGPVAGQFLYLPNPGGGIFQIGDSVSQNGALAGPSGDTLAGMAQLGALSWLGWALPLTQGRFRFGGLSATVGYTTTQILATHLPKALISDSEFVLICAGTNDYPNSIPIATSRANLTTMVQQAIGVGKVPILCTIPPQDANNTGAGLLFITQLNEWIRRYANVLRLPLLDIHSVVVNSATNQYASGYSGDGIHPNSTASRLIGLAFANLLNALPGLPRSRMADAYNPNFPLPDVAFTSALSDKWVGAGNTTGGWAFKQPTTVGGAEFRGGCICVTRGSAGNYTLSGPIAAGLTAGHRVRVAFALDVSLCPAGGSWLAGLFDTPDNVFIAGFSGNDQILTNSSVTVLDGVITAGTLNVLTSASAPFKPSHVGHSIIGAVGLTQEIPVGTIITKVSADGTTATMSANGTAATSIVATVLGPPPISVWEFVVPSAVTGKSVSGVFAVQGVAGVTMHCAQFSVIDLTALGAA